MEIIIKIPKEFEGHFNNDKFKDSLARVMFDIKQCAKNGKYEPLSGLYEFETLEMLEGSLENATVIPKGHGRLIDADELYKQDKEEWLCPNNAPFISTDYAHVFAEIDHALTIIEADRGESEEV